VRLRKYVVTEYVTVRVPVKREEVSIERIPIDEDDGEPADGPELVLMTEEPVIEKHVVARERVRLHKDVTTGEHEVTETLRSEQAEVETGQGQMSPGREMKIFQKECWDGLLQP